MPFVGLSCISPISHGKAHIVKLLTLLAGAAALAVASVSAHATTFNFSYTFNPTLSSADVTNDNNPVVVNGSFTGALVGSSITDIANVQVALNGLSFSGPLFVSAWNAGTANWDDSIAPVISLTDVSKDNFVFADTDVATNPGGVSNYFYVTGSSVDLANTGAGAITFNATDATGNALSGFSSTVNPAAFAVTAAVPEPESYALAMIGLGIFGFGFLRRRQA